MSNELMSLEDQARLNRTQAVRETIISQMVKDNKIPEDNSDRDLLMKALDGMDRQVLAKAKIKSDDQSAKQQAEMTNMVTTLLLQLGQGNKKRNNEAAEVPELDLPAPDIVPDETFIGVKTFSYSDIVKS